MSYTNSSTRAVYVVAIDRLEAQLEATKGLPDYAIALIVLVSFIVVCVVLQAVALLVISPCYYTWRKFQRIDEEHGVFQREMELQRQHEVEAEMAPQETQQQGETEQRVVE